MRLAPRLVPLLALALGTAPPMPAHGADVKMAVVVAKGRGAPNLRGPVRRLVEKPLKKEASIIPFGAYKKAGRKVKIRGKAVTQVSSAAEIGAAAGLTHVLVIESLAVREQVGHKKKKVYYANATLVDIASGEPILTKKVQLRGRKLTAEIAAELLSDVSQGLKPQPEPEPEPEPEAPPPPPPPPTSAEEDATEGPPVSATTETSPGQDTGAAPPPDQQPDEQAVATPSLEPLVPVDIGPSDKWRPALRVGLGLLGFQREGFIKSPGEKPPFYGAEGDEMSPFFPGGALHLEVFPLAFGGDGAFIEGIGLHVEGLTNPFVETVVDDATNLSVKSKVFMVNGGVSLRVVFWDSKTAPDFQLRLGYFLWAFPLKKGYFPGVQVRAPYAGGKLAIPILDMLAITLGGFYYNMGLPAGSGPTKKLGKKRKSGSGFRGEGGIRLSFAPLEVSLIARYDGMQAKYKGETKLATSPQYTNVKFTDRIISGVLMVGVVF